MLAVAGEPLDSEAHLFEIKWDGVRALAEVAGNRWALWGRGGVAYTARYPELGVLSRLPAGTIVDGELVMLREGRADFPALLSRHQRVRAWPRGDVSLPVCYVLFDLLYLRGQALLHEALIDRRARLRELLAHVREPLLAFSDGVVGDGKEFYTQVVAQGHEGVMAKLRTSHYRPGRSPAWRKIKPRGQLPCVIVGYRAGRSGVERLLVATVRQGVLRYVGQVHRGLDAGLRAELARRLTSRPRRQPVVSCPRQPACWVEPECYCQVRFTGWTGSGHLRYAVFGGLLENA
jgi:DNA ligase D-like protein (predicted ligase)